MYKYAIVAKDPIKNQWFLTYLPAALSLQKSMKFINKNRRHKSPYVYGIAVIPEHADTTGPDYIKRNPPVIIEL